LFLVFTKCRESFQDGRRLENISWRLWHRELVLVIPATYTRLCISSQCIVQYPHPRLSPLPTLSR
ncbi:hypothetical protein DEU56DRAFT_732357, partial [Suillus clintonianus]|uniref:uncharacterized protein n=1 Tax=Suillus clintonianus TaxID=1904413 RepID=UPI001B8690C1